MDENLTHIFTWEQFTKLIVLLIVAYWFFKLLKKGLEKIPMFSEFKNIALTLLHKFLTVFQPLAFIIALSVLVFINPLLHGVIMGLVLLFSFLHLKNYLSGRLVLLDGTITPEKKISYNDISGTITRCGHLGIQVLSNSGINHISYSNLLNKGYTIIPDDPGSFSCKLIVENDEEKKPADSLKDLLAESPYIDTNFSCKIESNETYSMVHCHLYFPDNLPELLETLKESGYNAKRA
ncbi:MAG: hypothetical protein CMN32_13410 [Saprospirales bacterium]|nr:hypothetical protein [Saprospirales bacterium]